MSSNSLQFDPLTPRIGAEVHGIDLTQPLSDTTFEALHDGWMRHQVLFFRDQALDIDQLKDVGHRFGELHVHPMGDLDGHPGVVRIHTDASTKAISGQGWHTDVSCDESPPSASMLHLHTVPEVGGDTLFASMYDAYDALSPTMAGFLDGLEACHSGRETFEAYFGRGIDSMRDKAYPEAIHPVVRTHPVTGRKALFVNWGFTTHIIGLEPDESRALLDFLYQHLAHPNFQCRFRWRENSVAFWDNRSTQHLALWDYFPETRSGHRFTIRGDKPFLT